MAKFSSTNQPNRRRGKSKSSIEVLSNVESITRAQYNDILSRLPSLTKEQAQELVNNPNTPLWIISRVQAMWKDISKGRTDSIREIEERLFGKPSQGIDLTSAGGKITNEPLTVEIIDNRDKVVAQEDK